MKRVLNFNYQLFFLSVIDQYLKFVQNISINKLKILLLMKIYVNKIPL